MKQNKKEQTKPNNKIKYMKRKQKIKQTIKQNKNGPLRRADTANRNIKH